jgi:hypothetical protein
MMSRYRPFTFVSFAFFLMRLQYRTYDSLSRGCAKFISGPFPAGQARLTRQLRHPRSRLVTCGQRRFLMRCSSGTELATLGTVHWRE